MVHARLRCSSQGRGTGVVHPSALARRGPSQEQSRLPPKWLPTRHRRPDLMTTSYLTDLRTLWVVRGYPHYFMFKLLVASSAWINTALMLPILIFKFEASPTQMAVISLVTGAPFVILGPYLGSLADRKSPIAMMIGGAVYRSFMLAGLAFAPSIEVFALIMFLNAVGSSANVADPVITRRLLTDDQIVTATSIRGLLDQSTKLVAPLIGAGLALGTSSQRALLVPAAMAALSAWCMILLGRRVGSLPAAPSSGKKEQRNLRALRNILATNPPIKAIVVLTIGSTITMGMHGSVLLFLLREQALPPNAFAFHMTCTAIGGIAASLVFKKWIIGRDQVKILYWCMTGFCNRNFKLMLNNPLSRFTAIRSNIKKVSARSQ
ncbi:MAG: MFS transporter [Alcaligenaceae bacterium]|nr:MAG: MFS transporter [Alcaligenaceae bacterium]